MIFFGLFAFLKTSASITTLDRGAVSQIPSYKIVSTASARLLKFNLIANTINMIFLYLKADSCVSSICVDELLHNFTIKCSSEIKVSFLKLVISLN